MVSADCNGNAGAVYVCDWDCVSINVRNVGDDVDLVEVYLR